MKKIGGLICSVFAFLFTNAQEPFLIVGTYTSTGSDGIYVYQFNEQTGDATKMSYAKISNPSFLVVSPDMKFVYAVNEDNSGSVSAFSFNKDSAKLSFINQTISGGVHPCYINIGKGGKYVITGNYSSGSIAVSGINYNGSVSQPRQIIQHKGKGVNEKRQEGPHVHSVVFSPDYKYLFAPDLGLDKIMAYKVAPESGALSPAEPSFVQVKPGAGPRHFEFHPNGKFAYLMEEMSGAVSVFKYEEGKLNFLQNISSHPLSFEGDKGSADIHVSPDGRFLYCSNRGDANSIAIFSINQETGMLRITGFQPTLGLHPRNFTIDPTGNFLLVANRDSDEIVIFKIDKQTGLLEDTKKRIPVLKPVCLKWIVKISPYAKWK
ncbi:MAG: lactonase family protein [Lacibacter sp.]